jgi:hypothetical protein
MKTAICPTCNKVAIVQDNGRFRTHMSKMFGWDVDDPPCSGSGKIAEHVVETEMSAA